MHRTTVHLYFSNNYRIEYSKFKTGTCPFVLEKIEINFLGGYTSAFTSGSSILPIQNLDRTIAALRFRIWP